MKEEGEDIEDEEVFEKEGANRRKENEIEKEKEKQCCQMYRKNKKIMKVPWRKVRLSSIYFFN